MKQILPILLSFLLLTGCSGNSADGYQQITQEEAKEMMDTQEVIILDVREQDEYDSGSTTAATSPAQCCCQWEASTKTPPPR